MALAEKRALAVSRPWSSHSVRGKGTKLENAFSDDTLEINS